jgi:RHS repeat-associated protein
VYYYFSDAIGTAQLITNSTGTVCYDSNKTPFGYEMAYTTTCAQNYMFAGMERDSETGNDHTWFRNYEQNLGRWMSPDLLGGDITNPQSLNRYAYALNNPTTLIDPLGLQSPGDNCNGKKGASLVDCVTGIYCMSNPGQCSNRQLYGLFDEFDVILYGGGSSEGACWTYLNFDALLNFLSLPPSDDFGGSAGIPANNGTLKQIKQTPQQKYQDCMSGFKSSTLGKVIEFGSLLSFVDDFKGTAENWLEAITIKGIILGAFFKGANTAAGGTSIVTTAVKPVLADLGMAAVAGATVADAAVRSGCRQAAQPELYQYTNRMIW